MPRYFKKKDAEKKGYQFEEMKYSDIFKEKLGKDTLPEGLASPESNNEMEALIVMLRRERHKIDMQRPAHSAHGEPQPPSTTYSHIESSGIAGEHDEERMTKTTSELPYSEEEYQKLFAAYEAEHRAWEENRAKSDAQYQATYGEKYQQYLTAEGVLNRVDSEVRQELKKYIVIPTESEIYESFINKFKDKNYFKDMMQEFVKIHKNEDLSENEKIQQYLEVLFANYRGLMRTTFSFAGLTGQWKAHANDLRKFCKDTLGLDLPKEMKPGQQLSISLSPMNQSPLSQYIEDRAYGVKFTAGSTAGNG